LVLFSNTINNYTEKYHKLNRSITSKKRSQNLQKTFSEIQAISNDIRELQVNFIEQFEEKGGELSRKWKLFARRLGEYMEAVVQHTFVIEEFMESVNFTSFWKRLIGMSKTLKILSQLDDITEKCMKKGAALNELIQSGKYTA